MLWKYFARAEKLLRWELNENWKGKKNKNEQHEQSIWKEFYLLISLVQTCVPLTEREKKVFLNPFKLHSVVLHLCKSKEKIRKLY